MYYVLNWVIVLDETLWSKTMTLPHSRRFRVI